MRKAGLLALKFVAVAMLTSMVVSLVLLGTSLVEGDMNEIQRTPLALAQTLGLGAGVSLPFVLVGGLLFGIPSYLFMASRGIDRLPAYLAVGSVVGMVAASLLLSVFLGSLAAIAISMLLGAVAGLTAALLWWLAAVRPLVREKTYA